MRYDTFDDMSDFMKSGARRPVHRCSDTQQRYRLFAPELATGKEINITGRARGTMPT
ncbi:MAG: hypothetical protein QM664_10310 [Flavihumibacter sp.]